MDVSSDCLPTGVRACAQECLPTDCKIPSAAWSHSSHEGRDGFARPDQTIKFSPESFIAPGPCANERGDRTLGAESYRALFQVPGGRLHRLAKPSFPNFESIATWLVIRPSGQPSRKLAGHFNPKA